MRSRPILLLVFPTTTTTTLNMADGGGMNEGGGGPPLDMNDPELAAVQEVAKNVHAFMGALVPGLAYTGR